MVKNSPARQEKRICSLGQEDPLEEEMELTPVFLPGEFHGQRSLVGYGPWRCKGSDTTEAREYTGIAFETNFSQSDEVTLKTEFQVKLIILKIHLLTLPLNTRTCCMLSIGNIFSPRNVTQHPFMTPILLRMKTLKGLGFMGMPSYL